MQFENIKGSLLKYRVKKRALVRLPDHCHGWWHSHSRTCCRGTCQKAPRFCHGRYLAGEIHLPSRGPGKKGNMAMKLPITIAINVTEDFSDNTPEKPITIGGALANALEQAAAACEFNTEDHALWLLIDDLRDAGNDTVWIRMMLQNRILG